MVQRICGYIRAALGSLGLFKNPLKRCAICRRSLHHGGLLVHRLHLFANPAVTIVRCLSNTFAGIRPVDVPWFIVAQFVGGFAATIVFRWLVPNLQVRAKEVLLAHDVQWNR